jgi:methyl-accepting chemotaxis protein
MDLDKAIHAHSEWKVKLRMAMVKRERLEIATISADNCCPLGKWLHGEAKSRYGSLPAYRDCVTKHATFHREAGAVARVINDGDHGRAGKMLDGGTAYAAASSAIGSAILGLKKAAAAVA